jgi:negative regulator of flagellin synthesis FlgM
MKISKLDSAAVTQMIQQYQKSENVKNDADTPVKENAASLQEKVNLSATAKDIQQAQNVIAGLPEIRDEKVQELKSRVEQGNYDVSGEKIADKIVGESLLDIFA